MIDLVVEQAKVERYMRPRGFNHFRNARIEGDKMLLDVFMDGQWEAISAPVEQLAEDSIESGEHHE